MGNRAQKGEVDPPHDFLGNAPEKEDVGFFPDNCVAKEEVDFPPDFQPKAKQISPYLTTPISLLIGPQKARYTVPRAFLSESPQWSNLRDYHPLIALPGVNEDVGHTLVHYLYTGTFQKLQSPDDDELAVELEKNVNLYGVAAEYGLTGLKELVLEKIQNKQGLGDIFDILDTIKKASKTLLKDDLGLKPYIKRELKTAFESDDTLFGKERFIELFGEAKQFDRILMRIVAEIYSEKIAQISQNTPAVTNGSLAEAMSTTETSSPPSRYETLREEPATKEPAGYGELDEYGKRSACGHPVTSESKLDLSEGDPVQKVVLTLEMESSEKSEEPAKKPNLWDLDPDQDPPGGHPPVYPQGPSEDEFPPSVSEQKFGKRKGSVLYPNKPGWTYWKPSTSFGDPVPFGEPARKVKKENKGKNMKSNLDPEKKATPFAETVAETFPCAVIAPFTEVVPCAEVATYVEPARSIEAVPCIEAAPQENISPKKKSKEKKAKKGSKTWIITAQEDGKKINSQKAEETVELPDPVPGPSTSGETVHEVPPPPPIIAEPRTDNGADLVQHPDESGICASQATHLLVDDEWKNCPKCRALIHRLSLKLPQA